MMCVIKYNVHVLGIKGREEILKIINMNIVKDVMI